MPDTDDGESVELVPDQWAQGDDDTEGARERRAAQARAEADLNPGRDLADVAQRRAEEEADQDVLDEVDSAHDERVELATKDQQTLDEKRYRDELLDDAAVAMKAAYTDERNSDIHRDYGANDKQRSLGDRAHGRHELDEAAARPDDIGSAGLAAEGRRFQNLATIEQRRSTGEYEVADGLDESAREHREQADDAQADASGAVRKPEETPEALLPQARVHVPGPGHVRDKAGRVVKPNPSRSSTPDLSMDRPRER